MPTRALSTGLYLAFGWLTMGQLLSLPVLLAGLAMLVWAYTRRQPSGNFA